MVKTLVSIEPATGDELWSGPTGNAAEEVAAARAGWPEWAAHSLAYRTEALRRFANVCRTRETEFAELIAREIEKLPPSVPIWIYHIKPQFHDEIAAELSRIDPARITLLEQDKTYSL